MRSTLALVCALCAGLACADDRETYNRRAAAADAAGVTGSCSPANPWD